VIEVASAADGGMVRIDRPRQDILFARARGVALSKEQRMRSKAHFLLIPTTALFLALSACGDEADDPSQPDSGQSDSDSSTPHGDGGKPDVSEGEDSGGGEDVRDAGNGTEDGSIVADGGIDAPADASDGGPIGSDAGSDASDGGDSGTAFDGGDGGDSGLVDASDGGGPVEAGTDSGSDAGDAGTDAGDGGKDGGDAGACVAINMSTIDGGTNGVCLGGDGCTPQPLGTFSPTWRPPTATHQNVCTAAQISDHFEVCYGPFATQVDCDAFEADPTNSACMTCMITPDSAASHGPLIRVPGAPGIDYLNLAGCVAVYESCNQACAEKIQESFQCGQAACQDVCPLTEEDIFSYWDNEFCLEDSASQCCLQVNNEASMCIETLIDPSHAANVCFAGTGEEFYNRVVPLFCGP
jgi:hypothetical protein